ncbi:autotransporter outer membrane beta-barrel domain-containing protein [Erwinia sp. JUb26]|uniref:autotransporter outer membrane beta-barrel domain-containing protein n=1 Tax=Erwinia sp. JUb26 TaxID=2485126 RepID=UPI000F475682|nr:autotransporter outer membrane beta-barrel domain-containing protein [Erwinia sp. JUb26]ROR08865.1 outer membrane autotransporter protein [Erwinia sp. JUb26]
MRKNSFKLSVLAASVIVSLSAPAFSATTSSSVAVKDKSALSHDAQGQYNGGGAVFIGGSDLPVVNNTQTGSEWDAINTDTQGFNALVNSSGYKDYLNSTAPSLPGDANYLIYEDYQRAVHGERQARSTASDGYSVPVGVVDGLKMGTENNRYQKKQSVTLYQRDASGAIQYQKKSDGTFVLDTAGHKIPLKVSKEVTLDQNADVYIRPVDRTGGDFGLQNAKIYSQVKSLKQSVGAVTVDGNLQETATHDRARDVLVIKDTTIDNTLNTDSVPVYPSGNESGEEHAYTMRPSATGLSINSNSVNYATDGNGNHIGTKKTLTHQVAKTPNVILDNAQITAKNTAAVREDDNYDGSHKNNGNYSRDADKKSTAVDISGSGLYVSVKNNSTLTGGVNNAGSALNVSGHANRVDVNSSTLNGNVNITHDGYKPTINVNVVRDTKTGEYVANDASITNPQVMDREHNGTTLNLTNNTVVNGDITAGGSTGFDVQLTDVTDPKAPAVMGQDAIDGSSSASSIYKNTVNSVSNTLRTNDKNAWTAVTVNLNHSTLNGKVGGITNTSRPDDTLVSSWNPDMNVKDGAVWNAAATADGGLAISDVHDMNLSNSSLNLINQEDNTATLGDRGRYEDLGAARVVVHGNLNQDKDSNGHYQTSDITVGKSVVDPLLNLGGNYTYGSVQVKGTAKGEYHLKIANSGVEPYVKDGYVADRDRVNGVNPHSFVNYLDKGSDAHFTGRTELGVYQYDVHDTLNDKVHDERNVYFKNNGHLSNSAATALSMAAAQVNVASMESDALNQHMTASRHARDDGGVWISYFGGENHNTTSAGAGYKLNTNGVMLGVDNLFDAKNGGSWLAGLAFSSARSDLDVMNSSGDLDSYGAQFYLSRRFENGIFVDTSGQYNHFSNSGDARTLDGQRSRSDFSTNGYGLGMKLGYTWEDSGYFAEPYVQATGRVIDGAHYTMNNGMVVNGDDFKSMVGEIGTDVGYTFDLNEGYIKPYLHMAALNEFADSNETRLNNINMNNSIDGAAFQIGGGAEVQLMKNVGGYASFNYTTGDNLERPWQANVGVNYSW